MVKLKAIPLLLLSLVGIQCDPKSDSLEVVTYLDEDYPGLTPKKYAQGIINLESRYQQNLTMSPDGREHYITQTDSAIWRYERILRIRQEGDGEVAIDTPQFVQDFTYQNEWFIGEPMLGPDNKRLYFVADYPPNLWWVKRTTAGDWSNPEKMSISTDQADWYPTFSKSGQLYFTNGTVFQSQPEQGAYQSKTKLVAPFNEGDVRDPVIGPHQDYLIFSAEDEGSYGQADLYVSFMDAEGNWTSPQNLGSDINTTSIEFAPYISPDEKFLFFSRRDQWQKAQFSNIYWVSMELVEAFRQYPE